MHMGGIKMLNLRRDGVVPKSMICPLKSLSRALQPENSANRYQKKVSLSSSNSQVVFQLDSDLTPTQLWYLEHGVAAL